MRYSTLFVIAVSALLSSAGGDGGSGGDNKLAKAIDHSAKKGEEITTEFISKLDEVAKAFTGLVDNVTMKNFEEYEETRKELFCASKNFAEATVAVAGDVAEVSNYSILISKNIVEYSAFSISALVQQQTTLMDRLADKGLQVTNTLTQLVIDLVDTKSRVVDQLREDINRWIEWPNLNRHIDNATDYIFYFRSYMEALFVVLLMLVCIFILRKVVDTFVNMMERKAALESQRVAMDHAFVELQEKMKQAARKAEENICFALDLQEQKPIVSMDDELEVANHDYDDDDDY